MKVPANIIDLGSLREAPYKSLELRALFYSHDGLGLGHMRRNLAVAAALTDLAPRASVLMAVGADELSRLGIPSNVEILKLPGLRKLANERYVARYLPIPAADIVALRSALLVAAVQSFRPTVILVDKHPLGASGELRPALEVARANGARLTLGLRDILDDRGTVLSEWASHDIHAYIDAYYELVFVYGHRTVFDPINEYDLPTPVAERTRYCGYVVNPLDTVGQAEDWVLKLAVEGRTRPVVMATAGGGEDGFSLLKTFIGAALGAPWDGIVIIGPMAPQEERRTLQRLAAQAGVTIHTFVPGLPRWFGLVDALVCMGGYNTVAEAVFKGTPTVCVPRTRPRSEQLIRARSFARLGLLRVVEPEQLDVHRLRWEVSAALGSSRQELINRARAVLNFDGAWRAAGHLLELAQTPGSIATIRTGRHTP